MEKFEELKKIITSIEADVEKSDMGVAAAGTRIRKAMQDIKVLAQGIRTEITERKNSGK